MGWNVLLMKSRITLINYLHSRNLNMSNLVERIKVLEYLIAHGVERVIDEIQDHSYQLSALSEFEYVEPSGKDQGINVRKKSQNLLALIRDKDKIQEVRQKAAANRDKYCGLSSTGGYKPSSYSGIAGGYRSDHDDSGYRKPFRKSDEEEYRFGRDNHGEKHNEKKQNDVDGSGTVTDDKYGDDDDFERLRDHSNIKYSSMNEHNPSQDGAWPKQNVSSTSVYTDDDFDDFDPRGTPASGATIPTVTANNDLFGSASPTDVILTEPANSTASIPPPNKTKSSASFSLPPPPRATNSSVTFPAAMSTATNSSAMMSSSGANASTTSKISDAQEVDFFGTSSTHSTIKADSSTSEGTAATSSSLDLFAGANFNANFEAPLVDMNSGNEPSDDLFGQGFVSAKQPSSMGSNTQSVAESINLLDGNFVDSFGTMSGQGSEFPSLLQTEDQHSSSTESEASRQKNDCVLAQNSDSARKMKSRSSKDTFQPKSSIWAESLSRGLVDLNLSGPKTTTLVDMGIMLDSNPPQKKELERTASTIRMGKAMGSGSGLGRLGASTFSSNSSLISGALEAKSGMAAGGIGSTIGKGNLGGSGVGMEVGTELGIKVSPTTNMFENKSPTSVGVLSGSGTSFSLKHSTGAEQGVLNNQMQQFGRFS
eukprot:TRINITY_DN8372_c0_g1_i3.p1 TRINITY_DN8372_c0_g1~~TRINITY_DN8372_c0_g1_i3.p1  ORF type:complete len:652 (+),score=162.45 TRINITY_DN8372_c0_g1_i3:1261-3216(+)